MSTFSIVIVNWNSGSQLRSCITSVDQAAIPATWRLEDVVIVDNASNDGSADRLECLSVVPKVLRNEANRGFAAACNQGAAATRTDAILFLNPDTLLYGDSLAVPLGYLDDPANADVGIVGIQLREDSGQVTRSCARFPRARHFLAQCLGVDRLLPATGHYMRDWDHSDTRQVDQVIGAFFLVRRTLFDELDGFDERFFVYFEEVDFALRALRRGHTSVYLATANAFHAGGGTSHQIKGRRLFYSLRSRLQYGAKHFNAVEMTLLVLVTVAIEPLARLLHLVLTGRFAEVRHLSQGYTLLLRQGLLGSA